MRLSITRLPGFTQGTISFGPLLTRIESNEEFVISPQTREQVLVESIVEALTWHTSV